jgi:hypothetical protein
MNTVNNHPFRVLLVVFFYCFASIIISSCSQFDNEITPDANIADAQMPVDAYSRTASVDCSTLNETSINTKYRNQLISTYGSAIGPWYDSMKAGMAANPNAYSLNPTYVRIYTYLNSIKNAIRSGSADLAASYCIENTLGCNTQVFWTSYLKDAIDVYLNPIKSSILGDGSLTSLDRDVLNNVIQAYYDQHEEASGEYGINARGCFPNPSWYTLGTSGGVTTFGLFAGIGKAIRKTINIAATILTEVVERAAWGAIWGAILGAPFGVSAPGVVVGAICGGVVGIAYGVNRCINGGYVCIVGPCN